MKINNTNKRIKFFFKYLININAEELKINIKRIPNKMIISKIYNLLRNYFIFIK